MYKHEHLDASWSGHATWYALRPFSSSEFIVSCAFAADGSALYCHTFGGEMDEQYQIMNRHKIWKFELPVMDNNGEVVFTGLYPSSADDVCPFENYSALVVF